MKKFTISKEDLSVTIEHKYWLHLENPRNPTPRDIVNTIKGTNKVYAGFVEHMSEAFQQLCNELTENKYVVDGLVQKTFSINGIIYTPGQSFFMSDARNSLVIEAFNNSLAKIMRQKNYPRAQERI